MDESPSTLDRVSTIEPAGEERQLHDAEIAARKGDVWTLLRPTPRIFVLSFVMFFQAATVSAREVARIDYVTASMGDARGIGTIAVVFSISMALMSLFVGRFVDVRDARRLVVGSLLIGVLVTFFTASMLSHGTVPVWFLVTASALEGMYVGVLLPSFAKVQAAIVRPNARGAAEILNILRSGVGGLLGATLAGFFHESAPVVWISGVMSIAVVIAIAITVRPVHIEHRLRHLAKLREVIAIIRANPSLVRTIRADMMFAFVLPTQFIALVIVDRQLDEVKGGAVLGGMLGVLFGRLVLTVFGLRGDLRRSLLVSYVAFLVFVVAGCFLMIDDFIFHHPPAMASIITIGSATMTYAIGVVSSLLQQQVPEEVRGATSGAMGFVRYVLIATSAAITASIAVATNAIVLSIYMAITMLIGLAIVRRFRGVGSVD